MQNSELADRIARDIANKLVSPAGLIAVTSIGDSFRDKRNRLYHVRGKVDGMLVCRYWRATQRRWEYEILDEAFFAKMVMT